MQFLYYSKVLYSEILGFRKAQPTEMQNAERVYRRGYGKPLSISLILDF